MTRLLLTALLSVVVTTGCGGGGGAPSPPPPQAQSITFTDAGPVYKFVGDAPYADVASGGSGTGAIAYASDTPSVATIDAQRGMVTVVAAGLAQVTATKAADASYLSAQATYTLRVAPRTAAMSAWIGASDTEISFAPLPLALGFTRSSDINCNPTNFTTCSNGTQSSLSSMTVNDQVATLNQPAIYWLNHGSHFTDGIVLPEQKFANQVDPGVVVFNGRLWLVSAPPPNQIWSSADGSNWRLETATPGFPARETFRLVVFNNALWVIGGIAGGTVVNDVWTSTDGRTWTEVTAAAAFPTRSYFAATAFNGRLWVTGGWTGAVDLDDAWSSADGANWTQATAAATAAGREQHELLSFNGKLWMIGGWNFGLPLADVWSSADGVSWTQATSSAAFGRRFSHKVVSDGTTMWLTAGRDAYQSAQRDVWSSTDGATWMQVTNSAEFKPRGDHGSVWWNGAVWVIGGGGSEVWSSPTGVHWSKQTLSTRIPGASALAAVSYRGRVWVLGDEQQLWSSADGLSWVEETHVLPGSPNDPRLVALSDRLLLIGGWQYSAPNYSRDLWQSTDGQNWSQLASSVPFAARSLNQVIPFNGKVWAFVGSAADDTVPEVWSSPDAINWTRVLTNAPYAPRAAYNVLAYNNRIWVVAGSTGLAYLNDVWSSPDGVTWTQVAASTALPARAFGPGIALSSGMCLYGAGFAPYSVHDIWCSSDGSTWSQKSSDAPYGPVTELNGTVFAIGNSTALIDSTDLVWKSADGISWRLGYQNTMRFP